MKYIAFCDVNEYDAEKRCYDLAAKNINLYLAKLASENGIPIEIIAPTRTKCAKGFFPGRTTQVFPNVTLTVPPTFGCGNTITRVLAVLWTRLWLLMYLLIHVHNKEKIWFYHSLVLMPIVNIIKRLKKVVVVAEVRELYTDIGNRSEEEKRQEIDFLRKADRYIFASHILEKLINTEHRPFVLSPGIYRTERKIASKETDGKIHVVYAGTFNKQKGGAYVSIESSLYLPSNYCMHILGTGSAEETKEISNRISELSEKQKVDIHYDGCLTGTEFLAFLQKKHIGISAQHNLDSFSNTSFPSKVLTYLTNGLQVVSTKIVPLMESPIGHLISYSQDDSPLALAKAIQAVEVKQNVEKIMEDLHLKLQRDLHEIFV